MQKANKEKCPVCSNIMGAILHYQVKGEHIFVHWCDPCNFVIKICHNSLYKAKKLLKKMKKAKND